MALGTLTVVDIAEGSLGPVKVVKATIVGDNTYPAGGSAGLLQKLRNALKSPGLAILQVTDQSGPAASLARLEYDHTNDKLFARVKTSGVESAVADQSAITYMLCITAH